MSENPPSALRVLHVISGMDARAGGPVMAVRGLSMAQRAAGLEVAVVAATPGDQPTDIPDELNAAGVNVTLIGSSTESSSIIQPLVDQADVVHIHGLWEPILHHAARIARRSGRPYIFTPHGMLTRWSLSQKWLKKAVYLAVRLRGDLNGAAAIHCTSAMERDSTACAKVRPPILVEPLGVDLKEFDALPPAGSFGQAHGISPDCPIVLFLGRLHPGKGMEYLIPAMRQAAPKDAMLVAVGPDSRGFQRVLEKLAADHGVSDRVMFVGMLRGRDRVDALADATVFALPSDHENFGVVVIEALACGVPAIVSEGVAICREVVDSGAGTVIPVGDVEQLASEITRWLGSASLRREAAIKAKSLVRDRFDWNAVARRWVEHYRRISPRPSEKRRA